MRAGQLSIDQQVARFLEALGQNRTLIEVLGRAAAMSLPGWYLVAGCLYQTVWNVVTGQQRFGDLAAPVQIRNQARVHLWYEQKYGVPCRPHESSEAAIDTFEATTVCLSVREQTDGQWRIYAPHGLADVFNLVVRPQPGTRAPGGL